MPFLIEIFPVLITSVFVASPFHLHCSSILVRKHPFPYITVPEFWNPGKFQKKMHSRFRGMQFWKADMKNWGYRQLNSYLISLQGT